MIKPIDKLGFGPKRVVVQTGTKEWEVLVMRTSESSPTKRRIEYV